MSMACIFIIFCVAILIFTTLLYTPIIKISRLQYKEIIDNGLLHFTSEENAVSIMGKQEINGTIDRMAFAKSLGELVWCYPYRSLDDIEHYHEILLTKKDAKKYCVCLKLSGFSDVVLHCLYWRKGFGGDSAIAYRGRTMKQNKIEIVKKF